MIRFASGRDEQRGHSEMTATSVWAKACKHLSDTLSKDVFDRWISVIEVRELNDEKITLSVQNNFYQSWLEENYLPLIQTAVTAACGHDLKIDFQIDRTTLSAADIQELSPQKPAEREKPVSHQRTSPAPALNPKYTFDTFVVGPSNSFSHAASLAVAQSPGRAYNPLFLYGGVGLGKTHLMQAIGHYVMTHQKASVCYTSCE